jgi:hypothetical protein
MAKTLFDCSQGIGMSYGVYGHYHCWRWLCLSFQHRFIRCVGSQHQQTWGPIASSDRDNTKQCGHKTEYRAFQRSIIFDQLQRTVLQCISMSV